MTVLGPAAPSAGQMPWLAHRFSPRGPGKCDPQCDPGRRARRNQRRVVHQCDQYALVPSFFARDRGEGFQRRGRPLNVRAA